MNRDSHGDSPKGFRGSCAAEEAGASLAHEGSEEDQFRGQWESTNREMLINMARELETEHFLAPEAIARVLHIREDYARIILKRVRKGGRNE